MGVLDFIFGVLVLAVVFFVGVGAVCMHYDTRKLEAENEKLKEDLHKARKRKMEREYKNAKEVKCDKK